MGGIEPRPGQGRMCHVLRILPGGLGVGRGQRAGTGKSEWAGRDHREIPRKKRDPEKEDAGKEDGGAKKEAKSAC